jgi:hypothetical protein
MTANARWPLVIVASAVVVVVLTILDASGPLLAVPALWFLLVCTGMAFFPLLGIRLSRPLELALIAVTSIVIDTVVATALTLMGILTETGALIALVGVSLVGCGLQLLAARPALLDPLQRLQRQVASAAREAVSSPHR